MGLIKPKTCVETLELKINNSSSASIHVICTDENFNVAQLPVNGETTFKILKNTIIYFGSVNGVSFQYSFSGSDYINLVEKKSDNGNCLAVAVLMGGNTIITVNDIT